MIIVGASILIVFAVMSVLTIVSDIWLDWKLVKKERERG